VARVPYLTKQDLPPEHQDLLESKLNLRKALVNSPRAARASSQVAMFIRHHSRLDPRLREMALLQVGYLTRCAYEYAHHIELGRQFGVSDDDIRAIAKESAGESTHLPALDRAVLRAAREMTADLAISDSTFEILRQHLDPERLVDLVTAIGHYNGTARTLLSLQIDLEEDYRHYLDEFPLPATHLPKPT